MKLYVDENNGLLLVANEEELRGFAEDISAAADGTEVTSHLLTPSGVTSIKIYRED